MFVGSGTIAIVRVEISRWEQVSMPQNELSETIQCGIMCAVASHGRRIALAVLDFTSLFVHRVLTGSHAHQ